MKKSTKFWIATGVIFTLICNLIVWTDSEYYGWNKGNDAQDLFFFFVVANLDPIFLLLTLPIGIVNLNKWIDNF